MNNDFIKRDLCPLCHHSKEGAVELFSIQQLDLYVRVLECPQCGIAYKEYKPSESLIREIYGSSYVHYIQGNADEKSAEERVKRMGKAEGKKHLDYGCGGGGLVRCAQKLGWDSYGADPFLPDALLTHSAKGPFFKYSADSETLLAQGPFDVISLWAVVEHLDCPLKTFTGLVQNLKSRGRLYFNVPNAHSLIAQRKGSFWGVALLLEHTLFFTEKTIRYIAEELKLEIVTIRACGSPYPHGTATPGMESFGVRRTDHPSNQKGAPAGAQGIMFSRQLIKTVQWLLKYPGIRDTLRWCLSCIGTGDHFYVVFQKK